MSKVADLALPDMDWPDFAPPQLAWYVYSVLPARTAPPLIAPPLPAASLVALPVGDFTVLASQVPRAQFDRHDAAHRTADPEWMASWVQAHHRVNEAASLVAPCLPLAFGTLFSDLNLLHSFLAGRAAALSQALTTVEGQAEWRLTVLEDPVAHADWLECRDPGLMQLASNSASAGEGARFLIAKRLEKAGASARLRHLGQVGAQLRMSLAVGEAEDPAMSVWPEDLPAGLPGWTILAPRAADLAARLSPNDTALADTGLSLRLTGPWPAYSFARVALSAGANAGHTHG